MEKLYERIIRDNLSYVELTGLSTETPPTTGIVTGSMLHVVDSALLKAFNATSGEWVTQVELGGAST